MIKMDISIIIPTYNRARSVGITIESFLNQNYPKNKYEIIIADNNSSDDTKQVIENYTDNAMGVSVTYLFEGRQGVHYARNSAAKSARFELLYFTDDDMIADADLLAEIIKPFQFHKNVAIATGRVLPSWETDPPEWVKKYCNNYLLSLLDPIDEFVISRQLPYLYSCHQAILKKVLFETEGFNPDFIKGRLLGDGETGLNSKARKLGYYFGFNGASVTYHSIPQSRTTQKYLNRRLYNNSFAHSYTEIRALNGNIARLFKRILLRSLIHMPLHYLEIIVQTILLKDLNYLRFFIAFTCYYYGKLYYEMRYVFRKNFRPFVLKYDWLSNDKEPENLKI